LKVGGPQRGNQIFWESSFAVPSKVEANHRCAGRGTLRDEKKLVLVEELVHRGEISRMIPQSRYCCSDD